jgi:hypothetical protein
MGNPTANGSGDVAEASVQAEPRLPADQAAKPEWVAALETAIAEELKRHAVEPRPRTNLIHLETACSQAFRQWQTPTDISRSPWKDRVLEIRLLVLNAAGADRDKDYDLTRSDPFQMRVMPRVTNEQFDVFPGMDPAQVRDPGVRKEYEEAIAENAARRARWEREDKLEELIEFGVFRSVTFLRGAYPEVTSAQKGMDVIRRFLNDEDLIERFKREFERRPW